MHSRLWQALFLACFPANGDHLFRGEAICCRRAEALGDWRVGGVEGWGGAGCGCGG